MKTLILAAFIIIAGLASCTVTQPEEGVYYPQQRVYSNPQYDPYNNQGYDNTYTTRRVYDSNTGRYYDVVVYPAPVYGSQAYPGPVYSNRDYRRDDYRREYEKREAERREYNNNNNQQRDNEKPQSHEQAEKRLPDGTIIYPDGTVRLSNGEIKHR